MASCLLTFFNDKHISLRESKQINANFTVKILRRISVWGRTGKLNF